MNKEQFDKIFSESKKEFTIFTEEQLLEKLRPYQSSDGEVNPKNLAMFAYLESVKATTNLLYAVLTKVLGIKE